MEKVMIVDDNPIDQRITSQVFRNTRQCSEILIMHGAQEALAYIDKYQSQPEKLPNLILLDLDMPVMNGYDFLQRFKDYADDIKALCPIIVVTASDIVSDLEKMKADPHVVKLINKPLNRFSFSFF